MLELVTALTRAMMVARREGRDDDVRRINRALSALLTLDVDDDTEATPAPEAPVGPAGTRIGLGVAA